MAIQWTVDKRPTSLSEVYGLESLKKTAYKSFKSKQWPVAMLLQGETGSGKTTTAKIMAMMMNCKSPKENGDPCCECLACKDIIEDKYNRDTKSYTCQSGKSAELMSLVETSIKTPPFKDNETVIILNEVQELNKDDLKKLLEYLETTTPHVHFILTCMEALSNRAVINRCSTFKFPFLKSSELLSNLVDFLKKNNILEEWATFDPKCEVLSSVARSAYGSMRNAIQTMQTIYEAKPTNLEEAYQAMPDSEVAFSYDVAEMLLSTNTNKDDIFEKAIQVDDYNHMFELISSTLNALYVYKTFNKCPSNYAWMEFKMKSMATSPKFDKIYDILNKVDAKPYLKKSVYYKFICDCVNVPAQPITYR